MSLFDEDFYSPKVSPWEQKRLQDERWPSWRRSGWMRRAPVAWLFVGAGTLAVLLLFAMLSLGSAKDEPLIASPNVAGLQPISVVQVVERIKPAIVSVISMHSVDGEVDLEEKEAAVGSGIIYKADGKLAKVVTNHHVIDGAASVEIVLSDGQRMKAKLIGSDALTDLAVLEIDGSKVKNAAEFGDSSRLKEGETAVAVGHPFGLGYSPTFTLGIISSLQRLIPISLANDGQTDWEMELLQTDAAINHGNSGGALVNLEGEVIGINSMKVAQPGVEGLGFAIPSHIAAPIIEELETHGKIRRPYLGVATVDLQSYRRDRDLEEVLKLPTSVKDGIIVLEAYSPAADAGLRTNDVIVALDGQAIPNTLSLRKYLYASKKIGDTVKVDYYRGGKAVSVTVKLSENPE